MITGDNPLTAVHVAKEVEIMDRDALILDLRENPAHDGGMYTFLKIFELDLTRFLRPGLAHCG